MKLIISDSNHVVYLQTQNIAEFAGRMARFLPQQPPKQKKNYQKSEKVVDESVSLQYNTNRSIHWLSPNGKATDSDSVIFKVRILVAQLYGPGVFHSGESCRVFFVCNGLFAFLRAFDNGFWKIMKGGGCHPQSVYYMV